MRLDGIHHIAATTADADRCAAFYMDVLGLERTDASGADAPGDRMLHFGDREGTAGGVFSFFERPDAPPGRPGAGMVHRVVWRVAGPSALEYWAERVRGARVPWRSERRPGDGGLRSVQFTDPEGLAHELVVDRSGDDPIAPRGDDVPPEFALRGFEGVRCFCRDRTSSADLLAGRLGFTADRDGGFTVAGEQRRARYFHDLPPRVRAAEGAGTVHHVAWTCEDSEQPAWRQRVIGLGARVTSAVDRGRFRSIYFREPSGVLFEIATRGPGAAASAPSDVPTQELRVPTAA